MNKSNTTVYAFLREKSKALLIKQQLKWCETLQISNSINWKKFYKINYFSIIETKLRSFPISLNLRSVVINVQLAGFDIDHSEMYTFRLQHPETINHMFLDCKFVEKFWKDIEDWFLAILRCHFALSNLNKLFEFHKKSINF